jgi:hypothetical protein
MISSEYNFFELALICPEIGLKMVFDSLLEFRGYFEPFLCASQLTCFYFVLKETVFHETEKAAYHPRNSEKEGKQHNGAIWKAENI